MRYESNANMSPTKVWTLSTQLPKHPANKRQLWLQEGYFTVFQQPQAVVWGEQGYKLWLQQAWVPVWGNKAISYGYNGTAASYMATWLANSLEVARWSYWGGNCSGVQMGCGQRSIPSWCRWPPGYVWQLPLPIPVARWAVLSESHSWEERVMYHDTVLSC